MRRAGFTFTVALLATMALPAPVVGGAGVGISREVRTGAQAGLNTAVFDAEGNVVPGSYLSVATGIDISTYVENGDRLVTREHTLYATVQRYEVAGNYRAHDGETQVWLPTH